MATKTGEQKRARRVFYRNFQTKALD